MTHEELLAKLNNLFGNDFYDNADRNTIALRAVVELHNNYYGMCMECELTDYPCETIQSIQKELK